MQEGRNQQSYILPNKMSLSELNKRCYSSFGSSNTLGICLERGARLTAETSKFFSLTACVHDETHVTRRTDNAAYECISKQGFLRFKCARFHLTKLLLLITTSSTTFRVTVASKFEFPSLDKFALAKVPAGIVQLLREPWLHTVK